MTHLQNAMIFHSWQDYAISPLTGTIVFTNGCFDVLHMGHVTYLKESRELGDALVIGLNSDSSVSKLKGSDRPVNSWNHRAYVLAGLRYVDAIIKFEEDTPLELIKAIRPDIITKGGDYQGREMIGGDFVESYGGKVRILSFVSGCSTTEMLNK